MADVFYWTGVATWAICGFYGFCTFSIAIIYRALEYFGLTRDMLAAYWTARRKDRERNEYSEKNS